MIHPLKATTIYQHLADDTQESLEKAFYGCPKDMEGIVYRAIAKSSQATSEMMKKMLRETAFGFTKLQKDYSTGKIYEVSSSPIRDEHETADIHNFRPEAISRLKAFVQSPAIKDNEVDLNELLYKIAERIPGSTQDVLDAYKTAINSPHTTETTLIYSVHRLNFLIPHQNGEAACKDYAKDALDVFSAVADPKNERKHTGESLTDFYYTIRFFAPYDSKRVTALVNEMKKSKKNTKESLEMANKALLAATKVKADTNQRDL